MKKAVALMLTLCILVTAVLFLPNGLYWHLIGNQNNTPTLISPDSTLTKEEIYVDPADIDPSYSVGGSTHITLESEGIRLQGAGARLSEDGRQLTVYRRGTYVLRGSTENAQIVVDAPNGWVHLVLDGVSLGSQESAPIYIKNAGNVRISTTPGSENRIFDAENYVFADGLPKEEPFAAIYSAVDLFLCGTGRLSIEGNFRDALHCKDTLVIADIGMDVQSREDGLVAHDALLIQNAVLTVTAGGDAIKSSHPSTGLGGDLCLHSGELTLRADGDGMQADGRLLLLDGKLDIKTAGGYENSPDPLHSARALKSGNEAVILGGQLSLDAADDAIHANGKLVIGGGELSLLGANRAAVARDMLVTGGSIQASAGFRGLVSEVMEITGGSLSVKAEENAIRTRPYIATDDGFSLESGAAPSPDGRQAVLLISGGNLSLMSKTDDVIRARGSMTLGGGALSLSASDLGGEPIRCDGAYTHRGGIAVSFGSQSFLGTTSPNTDVVSVTATFAIPRRLGENLALKSSDGAYLFVAAAGQNYSKMRIDAPTSLLVPGKTYTLLREVTLFEHDGLPKPDKISGGLVFGSFTVDERQIALRELGKTDLPDEFTPEEIL